MFIDNINETWLNHNALFSRNIWTLYDINKHRTNNICESYNKKINTLYNIGQQK